MRKYHLDKLFTPTPKKLRDVYLVQIGRLYFEAGDLVEVHQHRSFFELTIITDGEGVVSTNGRDTAVKRGDIYLSFPYELHGIRSSVDAPMKYDFCSFYTDDGEYASRLNELTSLLSTDERVFSDERISALVCDAISEFVDEKSDSEELLHSIFKQIMIYLLRDALKGASHRVRGASGADAVCYRVMNYIDTHAATLTSLDELAEALGYNYSYLSDLFKRSTGMTVSSYYRGQRLELAREMLREGSMNVGEVAARLGYSSLYSFSRSFKEKFGISPKQYAMSLRQEGERQYS